MIYNTPHTPHERQMSKHMNEVVTWAWNVADDKRRRQERRRIRDWLLVFHRDAVNYGSTALKNTLVCPELPLSSFARLADLQDSQIDSNTIHVFLLHLCGMVPFAYQTQHIDRFSTYVLDCAWIDRALQDIVAACTWYKKVDFIRFKKIAIPCYRAANKQQTAGHFFLLVVCVEMKTFIILDSFSNRASFRVNFVDISKTAIEYAPFVKAAYSFIRTKLKGSFCANIEWNVLKADCPQQAKGTLHCGVAMLTYIVEACAPTFFTAESTNDTLERVYTHTWPWAPQDDNDPFVCVRNWMVYEICCKATHDGYAYTNFQKVLSLLEQPKNETDRQSTILGKRQVFELIPDSDSD